MGSRVERLLAGAAWSAVCVGLLLRGWQFAAQASLWVDEAALARNVLDRSGGELLGPLSYGQVAPPGFLLLTKAASLWLGASEPALRILPFAAALCSVPLFLLLARRLLRPAAASVATALFALAVPLIFWGSNLKPYSSDVCAAIAMLLMLDRLLRRTVSARDIAAATLGAAMLLALSQAVIFVLVASGALLAADALWVRREDLAPRLAIVLLWAALCGGAVAHGSMTMTAADRAYMLRFWQGNFWPRGPAAFAWLGSSFERFFSPGTLGIFDGSLHWPAPRVFVLLFTAATLAMLAERPRQAAMLAGPFAVALLAAMLHRFPFGARVGLFLIPLLLLLLAGGCDAIARRLLPRGWSPMLLVLLLAPAIFALWRQPPPWRPEHLRPAVDYLAERWRDGDSLWVYYGAGQAFEYYRRFHPALAGDAGVQVGDCHRDDAWEYFRQLEELRGTKRLWVLIAHDFSGPVPSERRLLRNWLDDHAVLLERWRAGEAQPSMGSVDLRLYDLSREAAARTRQRDEEPVERPLLAWTCYGTLSPLRTRPETLAALSVRARKQSGQ